MWSKKLIHLLIIFFYLNSFSEGDTRMNYNFKEKVISVPHGGGQVSGNPVGIVTGL